MRNTHKAKSEREREHRAPAREIERDVKTLDFNSHVQFTCVWIESEREGAGSKTDTERVDERKREFVWERERDRERKQAKKSERERKIL